MKFDSEAYDKLFSREPEQPEQPAETIVEVEPEHEEPKDEPKGEE